MSTPRRTKTSIKHLPKEALLRVSRACQLQRINRFLTKSEEANEEKRAVSEED